MSDILANKNRANGPVTVRLTTVRARDYDLNPKQLVSALGLFKRPYPKCPGDEIPA